MDTLHVAPTGQPQLRVPRATNRAPHPHSYNQSVDTASMYISAGLLAVALALFIVYAVAVHRTTATDKETQRAPPANVAATHWLNFAMFSLVSGIAVPVVQLLKHR